MAIPLWHWYRRCIHDNGIVNASLMRCSDCVVHALRQWCCQCGMAWLLWRWRCQCVVAIALSMQCGHCLVDTVWRLRRRCSRGDCNVNAVRRRRCRCVMAGLLLRWRRGDCVVAIALSMLCGHCAVATALSMSRRCIVAMALLMRCCNCVVAMSFLLLCGDCVVDALVVAL